MSTVLTSVRHFLALTALTLGANAAHATEPALNSCEVRAIDSRAFQINFKGQMITIVGWKHPGLDAEQKVADTYKSALKLAQNGQCRDAQGLLQLNLRMNSELNTEAIRVHDILLQNQNQISELGTERAFEQTQQVLDLSNRAQEYVRATNTLCNNTSVDLQHTFNIFPGPENLFAVEKKLPVIGVEDGALLQKSEALIPEELKHIDIFQLPIPETVKTQLHQAEPYFEGLTRDRFLNIIAPVTNAEHRRLILLYRNTIVNLRAQVKERNQAMIQRILAGGKNHALVVGQDHIPGLQRDLKQLCLAQTPAVTETLAPQVPATTEELPVIESIQ